MFRHFLHLPSFCSLGFFSTPHLWILLQPFSTSLTAQTFLINKQRKRKEFWWLFCFSLISRASFLKSYNIKCKNKVVTCYKRNWFGAASLERCLGLRHTSFNLLNWLRQILNLYKHKILWKCRKWLMCQFCRYKWKVKRIFRPKMVICLFRLSGYWTKYHTLRG